MLLKRNEFKNKKKILFVFTFFLLIVFASVCAFFFTENDSKPFSISFLVAGKNIRQTIYGRNAEKIALKSKSAIIETEEKISEEIDSSDISRINAGAGIRWAKTDDITIDVLEKLKNISEKSFGMYDPTHVYFGYENIIIDNEGKKVMLSEKNLRIELSEIISGVECAEAVRTCEEYGAKRGIICVGETAGVFGREPKEKFWSIGIKIPGKKENAILKLNSGFAFTCRRGTKTPVNTKVGKRAESGTVAATVIHSDGVIAAALANVCVILGKEKTCKILDFYGAEAVFFEEGGDIFVTPNILENVEIPNGFKIFSI
jgi:thiamine biosynthesis lipoprotein